MSFEEDKARLIKELADAQAETRDRYNMAPRPSKPGEQETDAKSTGQATPIRRTDRPNS